MITVNKFGGGILDGALPIKHLLEIFKNHSPKDYSVNVFSAFGKTTNNLEKILNNYLGTNTLEGEKLLNELKYFHIKIVWELFPENHNIFIIIEDIFQKMQRTLSTIGQYENAKYIYDQIVPFGEILAGQIISNYFSYIGIPNKLIHANDFLQTDSNFGSANVDKRATSENLKNQITENIFFLSKNIITEGFIGFSNEGMTTLGRGGSDYTAGLLGNLLNADKVILWKDVPGVMNEDPKLFGNKNVKKIDFLTYENLENLLKTVASGLAHPKTLNEVKEKKIPLQVRPFWDLESEGTIIS